MTRWWRAVLVVLVAVLTGTASCGGGSEDAEAPAGGTTVPLVNEDAYRANNRGVALLEQFDYEGAAEAFREALALDGAPDIARFNLAVALFHTQDFDGADREAREATARLPSALQPRYLLGLIARAENRPDDAIGAFTTVLEANPRDVGTNINLGQIYLEAPDYPAAIERLRIAYEDEPYNVTATYNLGLALVRSGDTDEGQQRLEEAQALRTTNYAITYGPGYLNEGRYAAAVASTGAEPELVDDTTPTAVFTALDLGLLPSRPAGAGSPFGRRFLADQLTDAGGQALAAALGGGVTPIDYDTDGDLDLFLASPDGERLVRNDGATGWTDVTDDAGLANAPPGSVPIGAIAADYDNDQTPDLFVLRHGESSLYRNDGGVFTDVSEAAGLPAFPYLPGAAAFADVDHDGDVDLLLAGLADLAATGPEVGDNGALFPHEFAPAPLLLLRNNQDGTFTDITSAAGVESEGHAVAIVPADFNNGRDIDLLVIDHDGAPRLFTNRRDFTFLDVASDVGLGEVGNNVSSVAVADLNHDDFPDVVFAGATDTDGVIALSDGRGRFTMTPAPNAARGASAVRLLDYDNDGLRDLFAWTDAGPRLARNLGDSWVDVSDVATADLGGIPPVVTAHALAVADVDGDGDSDIVSAGGGSVSIAENSGDPRNGSLRVALRGLVSNRLGIGAKVQLRAGSLSARLDTSAATPAVTPADVVFGLGSRPGSDAVRVLWPSGILQAEVPEPPNFLPPVLTIQELDREPSSCPLLFTWNGTRFEFVTDFLGGAEMGYWRGPDHYNTPDPVEYVRIRESQLRPRGGRLELRVTNELEEAVFFDRLSLVALAHPRDVEVYPNEGMTDPPKPHRLHGVRDLRVPARAVDDDGTDVTDRITELDRRYPEGFTLTPFRGYAATHTLTLDLGPGPLDGSAVLLLTGWTDYAFSSDNVAAAQAGLAPVLPTLQIKDTVGRWRDAVDIGIPVGRPQTIALDLADELRAGEREVRIVTNMRIYWDQIRVGRRASMTEMDEIHEQALEPTNAELRVRGFSAELHPQHTEPTIYDYARVTPVSPWKTMAGAYTRIGDVHELLTATDDRFAIAKDGDEVALTFDASQLDPLPDGWTRTYLLRADGFSKEMDINSASPDTVEPLPFHAMSRYPYGTAEHYPETPAHRRYRDTFNTRAVVKSVPRIDASQ